MLVYLILLVLLLLLYLFRNSDIYYNIFVRNFIFYIYVIALFFIYVFRSINVGTDYPLYYGMYFNSLDVDQQGVIEKGYVLLNSIAQHNNTFLIIPIFVFVISFLGNYLLSRILDVNKFSFLTFYLLTYLYIFSFNIIRQFIALGIVDIGFYLFFLAYKYNVFDYYKYLYVIIIIFLASLFHSSAYICLLFLLFPKIKFGYRTVLITGLFTIICLTTGIFRQSFDRLLYFFPYYVQKYNNVHVALGGKNIIKSLPIIIQFIFLYAFFKIFKNKIFNYKDKFILSGYLMFLTLYFADGDLLANRIQVYTYMFPVLFYSRIVCSTNVVSYNQRYLKIFKYCIICFWIFYYILRLSENNSGVIPYHLI